MLFFLFLICMPFTNTEYHTYITTYTGVKGVPGLPEFMALTTVDGQLIDYYDTNIDEMIPKQDWMQEAVSEVDWADDTKIRRNMYRIYQKNIDVAMKRFNQTTGVHTYQRMYGCKWNSDGFDMYGYDGEDFISLDLKDKRYIAHVPQASLIAEKWNTHTEELNILHNYYKNECVDWLNTFLRLGNHTFERKDPPAVFLLRKDTSSGVMCHATGFYPAAVNITWMKNGQVNQEGVETIETLPNEDGTFQKSSILNVKEEEWKRNQYTCVVQHKSLNIQKHLTKLEIKTNDNQFKRSVIIRSVIIVTVIFTGIIVFVAAAAPPVPEYPKLLLQRRALCL